MMNKFPDDDDDHFSPVSCISGCSSSGSGVKTQDSLTNLFDDSDDILKDIALVSNDQDHVDPGILKPKLQTTFIVDGLESIHNLPGVALAAKEQLPGGEIPAAGIFDTSPTPLLGFLPVSYTHLTLPTIYSV